MVRNAIVSDRAGANRESAHCKRRCRLFDALIQTAIREWAYARAYKTSDQRAAHLPIWNHMYNWHRPHGSLNSNPPISRLGLTEDNLLRHHI